MNNNSTSEGKNFVAFCGINPKSPKPPDWLCLLRHSSDYGGWRAVEKYENRKKKGGKHHGKK